MPAFPGLLKGIKLNSVASPIAHLLYADDLLLFGKASVAESLRFQHCLDTYTSWSGQFLNSTKSLVHFSRNVPPQSASFVADLLHPRRLPAKAKHLGLPLILPRSKSLALADLKANILRKISGWKEASLPSWPYYSYLCRCYFYADLCYSVMAFPVDGVTIWNASLRTSGGGSRPLNPAI